LDEAKSKPVSPHGKVSSQTRSTRGYAMPLSTQKHIFWEIKTVVGFMLKQQSKL
jgi:hypothetical protein